MGRQEIRLLSKFITDALYKPVYLNNMSLEICGIKSICVKSVIHRENWPVSYTIWTTSLWTPDHQYALVELPIPDSPPPFLLT